MDNSCLERHLLAVANIPKEGSKLKEEATMSAGKRLAKRSIVGTRICAPNRETGQYKPGMIIGSKNPDELNFNNCHTGIASNSKYIVRFESGETREFSESELVGPGFGSVNSLKLRSGQKTFVTHNGREVTGNVVYHRPQIDEVLINIPPSPGSNEVSLDQSFFFQLPVFI